MPTAAECDELIAAANELQQTLGVTPERMTAVVRQVFDENPGGPDEVAAALRAAAKESN